MDQLCNPGGQSFEVNPAGSQLLLDATAGRILEMIVIFLS